MNTSLIAFFMLVFVSVFLLLSAIASEVVSRREVSRGLTRMLDKVVEPEDIGEARFLRRPRLDRLTNFEKTIEKRAEFDRLRRLADQAGIEIPISRVLIYSIVLAAIAFATVRLSPLAWWVAYSGYERDGSQKSKCNWPMPSIWSNVVCEPAIRWYRRSGWWPTI